LKKVSEGTNIPFQTIARYESGENTPSIVQAYKLAYFYKFPLSDIFCIGLDNDDTEDDIMYILQNNYNLGNDDNE
jgi:transcriptional regulator with XRE-family HTH domain